jgi:eukaryotic-like serine/threonine-protein kinase
MVSTIDVLPGRYANPRPIGSGGMGRIFRATDSELSRDVAVKVLADRYASDEQVRARFRREALAAARLSGNPNIVTIFDVAEHHGRPLIVMEYLEGGSLESRIHGHGGCPPRQVLEWLGQAASALDAAHAAGVVHRDVKPANLLLDSEDQVHVADFGIASAAGLDSFTETGTILGSAGYLSPEQARGERATAASDRYSLGIVGFELLAGERPFAAASTTVEAARHVTDPVPSIHARKSELPRSLDGVFRRMLAKDPADRYPTAAEFVAELRAALHEDAGTTGWILPARATAPTAATRVARTPAVATRVARTPAVRRERNSARWAVPLLLVVLAAAGVAAAFAATRGDSPHAATQEGKPVTIVRTVTAPGETIQQTVTASAPPPPSTAAAPTPPTTSPSLGSSGATLANEGYAKMRAGDYNGALPLLEQAVQRLNGSGSLGEAYADYNLAYTRYALGQCTDVLPLLDHSERIQGRRVEIDRLRRDVQKNCG